MIAEARYIPVHGLEQWVTLRGASAYNPLLLLVPGFGAGFSVMTPFFAPWEEHFTVVYWDQPRAGATYARSGTEVGEYSFDRVTRDGIAVVEFLHRWYAQEGLDRPRVVPLALSGGTIVGLQMVKRRPDLFAAYVGSGQIVSWARQDALSYQMVLQAARAAANHSAVTELEGIGAPPYPDTATDSIKSKYSVANTAAELEIFRTLDPAVMAAMTTPPADAPYLPHAVSLPDVRAVATAAYDHLRPEFLEFDAERLGLDFQVPMLFLQGESDLCTVTSEVRSYVEKLSAPRKALVLLEGAGHSPWMMRGRFLQALMESVGA